MFLDKLLKIALGTVVCSCLVSVNTNSSEASQLNKVDSQIIDMQQQEVTAAEALGQSDPAVLVRGVPVTIPVNNIQKATPKEDLSKREIKERKLAERARKNAEKARLKAEKERIKAEKAKAKEEAKAKAKAKKHGKHKESLQSRIEAILQEGAKEQPVVTMDYGPASIMGAPVVTKEQALAYLLKNNPYPKLSVSPEEIVDLYYEEAEKEGVRPDAAFAQAMKETGYFNYGGTVTPDQNNYCGLGTTSATVKGAYFATAREGVRAHIQHLLAYATVRPPRSEIVDPRYMLVRAAYGVTTIETWPGLNGRWAVPGNNYGQDIMAMVANMAQMPK